MICDKFFFCASTCRGTPKQSQKTYSAGRKTTRYVQIRATDYELERNPVLGINMLRHTETVPKTVFSRPKDAQLQSKPSNRL